MPTLHLAFLAACADNTAEACVGFAFLFTPVGAGVCTAVFGAQTAADKYLESSGIFDGSYLIPED